MSVSQTEEGSEAMLVKRRRWEATGWVRAEIGGAGAEG